MCYNRAMPILYGWSGITLGGWLPKSGVYIYQTTLNVKISVTYHNVGETTLVRVTNDFLTWQTLLSPPVLSFHTCSQYSFQHHWWWSSLKMLEGVCLFLKWLYSYPSDSWHPVSMAAHCSGAEVLEAGVQRGLILIWAHRLPLGPVTARCCSSVNWAV